MKIPHVRKWWVGATVAALALLLVLLAPSGRAASRLLPAEEAERVLLAAAREGDAELVTGLVKAGTPVECRDARGFTPLILAAYHGQVETVEALLGSGAKACASDGRGNTALMGAAFKGHTAVVALLLKEPCAIDQANGLGQTALMFARLFGRGDVAALLASAGASAAKRDLSGRSAEDWARSQEAASPVAAPVKEEKLQ